MKRLFLFLLSSISIAFPCDDQRLQKAVIGGDQLVGTAFRSPGHFLRSRSVQLYLGTKLIWTGATDKNGGFAIDHLQPGTYQLFVHGWGHAEVQLKPELTVTRNGQRPAFFVMLVENSCIAVTVVMN